MIKKVNVVVGSFLTQFIIVGMLFTYGVLMTELEKEFGFDKPPLTRFLFMMWNYLRLDFGESYFRSISVIDLVIEKMPVSISLGLWSTLIAYMVSIPLGIRKAVHDGSKFDTWTSVLIVLAYAIPGFLFAILLLVLFAGGSYFQIFPLRGLTSENFSELGLFSKVIDYLWHISLPVLASFKINISPVGRNLSYKYHSISDFWSLLK